MLQDYKKLKPIVKKTRTIPYIKRKNGFPFLVYRYKKRKGFLVGLLIFCFLLYILSLYIWNINLQGGHFYTQEAMIKFLKQNNIYAGLQKKNIDCQEIEDLIRGTYKDIGWVSAEIKGTRLIIKITETNMPSPAVSATEPCHIVASKDCIITQIVTRTGTPMVDIGAVVKKGDILVSGVVDIVGDYEEDIVKKPVIADADIIGKSYYDYKDTFPLTYIKKQYTGNNKTGYDISILLNKINLYNPRNPYTKYDIIVNKFMLHLNENFYLPIEYSVINYLEYSEVKEKYSEAEATKIANEKLKRYLEDLMEKDVLITDNNVKITIDKNSCTTQGRIVVLESVKEFKSVEDSEWRIIDTDESDGNDN
jgi:similar to stage IV sporulation protein